MNASDGQVDRSLQREIADLRTRDNLTNWFYLAKVYVIVSVAIAVGIVALEFADSLGLAMWQRIVMVLGAIIVIGASQHQFGGATHEATHFALFENRKLNELVSDWLCMFPLYSSTYQFRLHHLAHHQYINDPERDPDFRQLRTSGHWLDFPVSSWEFVKFLLKQVFLIPLVRYTLTRAKFNALGEDHNPYHDEGDSYSAWPNRVGMLFAVLMPFVLTIVWRNWGLVWLVGIGGVSYLSVLTYFILVNESAFPRGRIKPVVSHRATYIGRATFLAIVYGTLIGIEVGTGVEAFRLFAVLWIVPLFTTFPFFMILRQVVQHGNGDRGRLTNTRVFLVNPFLRYAIFPFGMDYHLPHHMYASIPHYRLRELHRLLQKDPEYAQQGTVIKGYFFGDQSNDDGARPTVVDVLTREKAQLGEEIFIDDDAVAECEMKAGQRHAVDTRG